jgi:uncharacterized protein (TIGR03435 family)
MKPTVFCAWAVLSAALPYVALAQPTAPKVAFEVASIKPSDPQPTGQLRIGMRSDAGQLNYANVSLRDCIRIAYRVKDFQIEGSDALDGQRFDIDAKYPSGVSQDQIPEMLQALLAECFHLTLHRTDREHAIYALIVGKNGAKLKPAEVPTGNAPGGRPGPQPGGMQVQVDGAGAHLKAASATLSRLADMISRFSEKPVIDMTGIEGLYEFDLVFSPDSLQRVRQDAGGALPPPPGSHGGGIDAQEGQAGSIYDSVTRYGLKLEARKAQMPVLMVDRIEKMPTEN